MKRVCNGEKSWSEWETKLYARWQHLFHFKKLVCSLFHEKKRLNMA
jgi:hypothetical protein